MLIVDESTSVANVSCLVIYIKTTKNHQPVTFFFDLAPLKNKDAETVYNVILQCLRSNGITEKKLSDDFIQLTCDGASTFTGNKSGVGKLFANKYPKIVVWHCLAHRLELSIGDAKSCFRQFDELVSILKSIYAFYSMSPKNTIEIQEISNDLGVTFKKIGKVFTIRWAASSLSTVNAVLNNLEALKKHFHTKFIIEKDASKKSRIKYILENLRSSESLKNLQIMQKALEETSVLSKQLQTKNMTLALGHKSIMNSVRALKAISDQSVDHKDEKIIPEKTFFRELTRSIKERLFSTSNRKNMTKEEKVQNQEAYFKTLSAYSLHNKTFWPKDWTITYGDDSIKKFAQKFGYCEIKMKAEFRTFKETSVIGDYFQNYVDHANSYAISSADAERGFSLMNRIVTDDRNALLVENASSLMLISSIAMPIEEFAPKKFVKVWTLSHQNADSERNTYHATEKENDGDQKVLYDIFK